MVGQRETDYHAWIKSFWQQMIKACSLLPTTRRRTPPPPPLLWLLFFVYIFPLFMLPVATNPSIQLCVLCCLTLVCACCLIVLLYLCCPACCAYIGSFRSSCFSVCVLCIVCTLYTVQCLECTAVQCTVSAFSGPRDRVCLAWCCGVGTDILSRKCRLHIEFSPKFN